jgi:hypothetical protein
MMSIRDCHEFQEKTGWNTGTVGNTGRAFALAVETETLVADASHRRFDTHNYRFGIRRGDSCRAFHLHVFLI